MTVNTSIFHRVPENKEILLDNLQGGGIMAKERHITRHKLKPNAIKISIKSYVFQGNVPSE